MDPLLHLFKNSILLLILVCGAFQCQSQGFQYMDVPISLGMSFTNYVYICCRNLNAAWGVVADPNLLSVWRAHTSCICSNLIHIIQADLDLNIYPAHTLPHVAVPLAISPPDHRPKRSRPFRKGQPPKSPD